MQDLTRKFLLNFVSTSKIKISMGTQQIFGQFFLIFFFPVGIITNLIRIILCKTRIYLTILTRFRTTCAAAVHYFIDLADCIFLCNISLVCILRGTIELRARLAKFSQTLLFVRQFLRKPSEFSQIYAILRAKSRLSSSV